MKQTHATPTDDELLMSRAAWLYYVGGLNQEAAAQRLGVTRARVNKLLQDARETGLVSISINPSNLGMLDVEDELARRWGLDFCVCTPALGLEGEGAATGFALRAVGMAAANHLRDHLSRTEAPVIGTGWGRTLDQMTRHLAGVTAPQAKFVSVMGSLTANSSYNPFEVVHALARQTGGEGYVLPVPFIADSVEDRHVLMSQKTVQKALAIAESATVTYISLGELKEEALLRRQGMLTADDVAGLREAGAVGDTNGIFFDAEGLAVAHPLNERTVALGFETLRRTNVVALVAGVQKVNAARAFLKSGVARGLVIDGDTAGLLLET